MKKLVLAIVVFAALSAGVNAKNFFENELTAGSAGYIGYSINALFPEGEIEYGLNGSINRSSLYDFSFNAGAAFFYEFSDVISASLEYSYRNFISYPAVDVALSGNLLTYKNVLNSHFFGVSPVFKISEIEIKPLVSTAINMLTGYIIANRQGGVTEPEKVLADYVFGDLAARLDASYEIAEMFLIKAGVVRDFYTGDVGKILDASGTSNTVISADTAVKNAVKFMQYGFTAGASFFTDEFMAGFDYNYSVYWHPAEGSTNDFSNDFMVTCKYAFDERFIAGVRAEYIKSHYTDSTFLESLYLGLLLNFTAA